MKKLIIGILAHVDAGKTTLSESLLFLSGKIGKLGRVDNQDAYLDTYDLEKARGITIFAKQAMFEYADTRFTLLDTPGHADFSAEMERTLQVLDCAILVISGADGVQGHTRTLWQLFDKYRIPVFLFVNKMDQNGTDKDKLLAELKRKLGDGCIDFGQAGSDAYYDHLAMRDESMMNTYLETGHVDTAQIQRAVGTRRVFPCFFGSALRMDGIDPLLKGLVKYTSSPLYPDEFGAKVFKITRDEQGNRLTYLKITGGRLKVRDALSSQTREKKTDRRPSDNLDPIRIENPSLAWEEKVNQIRIYSGQKYETVNEVEAGDVCAVTGLSQTRPGEGLGIETNSEKPVLEPVLTYRILLPEGCDPRVMIPKLRLMEEEDPELHIVWDEHLQEIQAQLMGEVQMEILQSIVRSRFGMDIAFDAGRIVYKETITAVAEGVGHFEPLRHYAEVHLILKPGDPGSGLQFDTDCSEDLLGKSWQRLVLTHLEEKVHKGVLAGAPIIDMRITLVAGKASNQHTEGGDFREATYRAVRQGLKEAGSILLEPYYSFTLELPERMVGRAINDIEKMKGTSEISHMDGDLAILTGSAPVAAMKNYQQAVTAYTKGFGRLFYSIRGYAPCQNAAEVLQAIGYDSEQDTENPTGSVFCAHGAGFLVPWDQVKNHMHLEACLQIEEDPADTAARDLAKSGEARWISLEEIDRIINETYYANRGKKTVWKRRIELPEYPNVPGPSVDLRKETDEEYLLVDGYNIIHAWPELKTLADADMESARMKLLDLLSNYQGIRKCHIIVVFDAYLVVGHGEEVIAYQNLHMVFTREAQTADQYIERFTHVNRKKYKVTVATSDGLQQMIVRGAGGSLLSARELKAEMDEADARIRREWQELQQADRNYLHEALTLEEKQKMQEIKDTDEGRDDSPSRK